MQTELALKPQIAALLSNEVLTSLVRDKHYKINESTWIDIEGELQFHVLMDGDRLVIKMDNILPKLTAKRFLKFSGRINAISIGKENIIVELDGLPDQTLVLTD